MKPKFLGAEFSFQVSDPSDPMIPLYPIPMLSLVKVNRLLVKRMTVSAVGGGRWSYDPQGQPSLGFDQGKWV